MKRRNFGVILLSSTLLFSTISVLASCDNTQTSEVHVESVSISKDVTSLNVNETLTLTSTVLPDNATNKEVKYTSSNTSVATINNNVLTALKAGISTITVTSVDGEKTDSFLLTVNDPDENKLDIDTLLTEIEKDEYSLENVETKEKYGLSDVNNVGVNKEYSETTLYEIPSDDNFESEAIIKADELTLDDLVEVGLNEVNDYNLLLGSLLKAKNLSENLKKPVKVKLNSRTYNLDGDLASTGYLFNISNLNDVYIEGNGAIFEVSFSNLNYKGYVNLSNSTNVYFKDLVLRQKISATLTGSVTNFDKANKQITVKVNEEFYPLVEELLKNKKSLRTWVEFNKNTLAPLQEGNFVVDGFSDYEIIKESDEYYIKTTFTSDINEGPINTLVNLAFAQYDQAGFTINNSENIYLENITMNNASGMALTSGTTSNLYINRFNLVVKEDSSALMTSTADAMHFSLMDGDVSVTNSIIEYSHDDALNIKHGYFYSLRSVLASRKTLEIQKITSEMPLPEVGDKIAIYNEDDFTSYNPSNGYYTVSEATDKGSYFEIVVNERLSGTASWGNARVTFLSHTPNFTFKNNIIRNKRNRGILVQVPNALIENNTFINVGHGSIQAATAMDQFNEATLPQSLIIRNNKFINNLYIKPDPLLGDISIFAISKNGTVAPSGTLSNMEISNNYISKNGNASISLRGVSDSVCEDNLFYNCSRTQPTGEGYNTLFHLDNASDITIKGNYNEYTLDNGLSGIMTNGTTSEDMITLTDNTNVDFYKVDDVGPEIDVDKFTSPITLDGSDSDWENNPHIDIEITGATDSEGNQVDLENIQNNFKVNKLKMGYNDTGIYFYFDIYDNLLEFKTINDFWTGDCVELLMSTITNLPNADLQVFKEDGGVLQAAFAPTWDMYGDHIVASARSNTKYVDNDEITSVLTSTATGYTGEILIPFTMAPEFKETIDNNQRIAICIVVADGDRPNQKRVQAANVVHNVENNKTRTARMAQYLFK